MLQRAMAIARDTVRITLATALVVAGLAAVREGAPVVAAQTPAAARLSALQAKARATGRVRVIVGYRDASAGLKGVGFAIPGARLLGDLPFFAAEVDAASLDDLSRSP